jgi:hypothetical protein
MSELDLDRYAICACGHLLPALRIMPILMFSKGEPGDGHFDVEMTCPKWGHVHVRKYGLFGATKIQPGKETVKA